jgi:hypothetical protein
MKFNLEQSKKKEEEQERTGTRVCVSELSRGASGGEDEMEEEKIKLMLRGRGTSLLEITTCNVITQISPHTALEINSGAARGEEESRLGRKSWLADHTRFHLHAFSRVGRFPTSRASRVQ